MAFDFIGGHENSPQLRSVYLMRHAMLNFVAATRDYVAGQVLDVSWKEFTDALEDAVDSVDALYEAHNAYVAKAVFRYILFFSDLRRMRV